MSLIINSKRVEVPGVKGANFLDNKKLAFNPKHVNKRKGTPTSVCLHTAWGKSDQKFEKCTKPYNWGEVIPKRSWDRTTSWHISINNDGTYACHADLVTAHTFHAKQMNTRSIGIEIYQNSEGVITYESLETAVKVLDVITKELGIQRQFPVEANRIKRFASNNTGASWKLEYIKGGMEGRSFSGIFGHRNATRNRGKGDPGDKIFSYLVSAGYEAFAVDQDEDIAVWKTRQEQVGITSGVDGIPGPATRKALTKAGYKHGLWVSRPGD